MDGENNGKPYEQMDDSGGKPTIFGKSTWIITKYWAFIVVFFVGLPLVGVRIIIPVN